MVRSVVAYVTSRSRNVGNTSSFATGIRPGINRVRACGSAVGDSHRAAVVDRDTLVTPCQVGRSDQCVTPACHSERISSKD